MDHCSAGQSDAASPDSPTFWAEKAGGNLDEHVGFRISSVEALRLVDQGDSRASELSRVLIPRENYALGGRVLRMQLGGSERTVAWHTGAVIGHKSLQAHVPGDGKTVVIVNNTSMAQSTLASAADALLQTLY